MSKEARSGFRKEKHCEIFIPGKHTCAHTLLVATGFERENPDIFVLPSLLPGICLPVQVSRAATRGQKDATDCVLKSKLQNLSSPEIPNHGSLVALITYPRWTVRDLQLFP